jgi:hypothetical protein
MIRALVDVGRLSLAVAEPNSRIQTAGSFMKPHTAPIQQFYRTSLLLQGTPSDQLALITMTLPRPKSTKQCIPPPFHSIHLPTRTIVISMSRQTTTTTDRVLLQRYERKEEERKVDCS